MPPDDEGSEGRRARRTLADGSFLRRHRALIILIALPLVLLIPVAGWLWHLDSEMSEIPRFDADLDRPDRPPPVQADDGQPTNILLIGVDKGPGSPVRDALDADSWPVGSFRSDAIMVLHLEADQDGAQLISFPRDSWVPVPGHGTTKINHAFSYGGPALLIHTIEDLTQIRMDHVAVVDWEGFDGIIDAIGGVDVTTSDGTTDHLSGSEALGYVRERKTLPRGDFSRIQRQQNILRSTFQEVVDIGVLSSPVRLTNLIEETSEFLAVDDSLTNRKIRGLARNHRSLRPRNADFLTIPTQGTGTEDGLSIVRVDHAEIRALFEAVANDEYDRWADAQDSVDSLPPPTQIP